MFSLAARAPRTLSYPVLLVLFACGSDPGTGAGSDGTPSMDGGSSGGGSDSGPGVNTDSGSPAVDSSTGTPTDAGSTGPMAGPVSKVDTTVPWKHWNYTLNADNTAQDFTSGPRSIVDQTFDAIVLENDWVKVTLVPSFGARILSLLYKPTGHEELYQNPVGAPYGYMAGSFFYNWLMVYGGIFPTLVEPEHGKAWLLPWDTQIVTNTPDQVSVQMSITDNIGPTSVTPKKFAYGNTGLSVQATVTLYRDRSSVDMAIQIHNAKTTDVNYEYWTCTTLAPGSDPASPQAPGNTEIIAPISQIQTTWGGWLSGPQTRPWNQSLSLFSNWQDDGILYAYPAAVAPFWGAINHDAHEGLFRISDNSQTPGMKMWTWGYQQSQIDPTDPQNAANSARPYIELWGGVSHQFFTPAKIAAGATKQWTESYLPTTGLDQVTAASADGAAYVSSQPTGTDVTFAADFFSAHPGRAVTGTLTLDGTSIGSATLVADPRMPVHFEAKQSAAQIAAGSHQIGFVAADGSTTLLSATAAYTK